MVGRVGSSPNSSHGSANAGAAGAGTGGSSGTAGFMQTILQSMPENMVQQLQMDPILASMDEAMSNNDDA